MFSLVDILRNSRCHPSRCILAVLALCLGKSLFFAKFVKCSAIFCYPTKTTQPRPRVSQFPSLNFLVISRYSFDIIFQISQQKVFQICSTVVDDHWRISCGIWTNLISSILKEKQDTTYYLVQVNIFWEGLLHALFVCCSLFKPSAALQVMVIDPCREVTCKIYYWYECSLLWHSSLAFFYFLLRNAGILNIIEQVERLCKIYQTVMVNTDWSLQVL